MEYQNFIFGNYESQTFTADAEDTINWYPERQESAGATSKWALVPTPGVRLLDTAATTTGRAHVSAAGGEWAVIGGVFYGVHDDGIVGAVGSVALDGNPATISYNGDGGGQLFITSGGNGYIYDIDAATLTQVSALTGVASMGAHLDGYFLALDATNSKFYISNLLDGTVWNTGTDFAQRSQASDPWKSLAVNGKYVFLLGTETSEVWYDTGASFPFAPHPSGLIPYGIAAPFSVAHVGSGLAWLGTSVQGGRYVLQASGFTPEVVSNLPLQFAMSGYATVSDAVADSYNDLGHTFYILSFPSQDVTWAWDASTGQWTKRATWISEEGVFKAWRPRYHAVANNGQHRMLDAESGAIYSMQNNVYTDVESRPIRRVRRAPCLLAEDQRVFFSSFELDMEVGANTFRGNLNQPPLGPGLDHGVSPNYDVGAPQVMLRFSNDGGRNWSSELWRGVGTAGRYSTRVRWNRLGMARRRVFEVTVSDGIPWRLTNAYLALAQAPQRQGASMGATQ